MRIHLSEQPKLAFSATSSLPLPSQRARPDENDEYAGGPRQSYFSDTESRAGSADIAVQNKFLDSTITLKGTDGSLLVDARTLPPCLCGAVFGREAGYVATSPQLIRCKFSMKVLSALLSFHANKHLPPREESHLVEPLKDAARILGYQELSAQLQKLTPVRKRARVANRGCVPEFRATSYTSGSIQPQQPAAAGRNKNQPLDSSGLSADARPAAGGPTFFRTNELLSLLGLGGAQEKANSPAMDEASGASGQPDDSEARSAFAAALARREATKKTKTPEDLDRVLQIDPQNAFALEQRSQVHYMAGRTSEAFADIDGAIALEPSLPGALALRSALHSLAGRHTEALDDMNQAIQIHPRHAIALARRGALYASLGRAAEARRDLDQAISITPRQAFALAQRGAVHSQTGRLSAAFSDLDLAVALEPGMAFARACRGVLHSVAGRPMQAFSDLNDALLWQPENTFALAHRGKMHRNFGLHAEALDDLNRAIEIDSSCALALSWRNNLFVDARHRATAVSDESAASAL